MGSFVIILNNNEPMAQRPFSERRADRGFYKLWPLSMPRYC